MLQQAVKAWYKTKNGFCSFESANNLIATFVFSSTLFVCAWLSQTSRPRIARFTRYIHPAAIFSSDA
jgi:hypothetical protein